MLFMLLISRSCGHAVLDGEEEQEAEEEERGQGYTMQ